MIENFIVTTTNRFVREGFEKRGITLALLQRMRDLALKMNPSRGFWTIGRVSALLNGNHEILKVGNRWGAVDPRTTLTHLDRSSLIDMLQTRYNDTPHPLLGLSYIESVGVRANIFISFAYSSDYVDLVDAVECYMEKNPDKPRDSTYFWFDLFVNNQWGALDKDFEWWATTFREAVDEIGETMLILQPWINPEMLTRAWCLYEICCSKKISIGMSRMQLTNFYDTLKANSGRTALDIVADLGKIDLENASAYLVEDKEKIFAVVRATKGGFHEFNVKVTSLIREWVSGLLRQFAASIPVEDISFEDLDNLSRTSVVLMGQGLYNEAIVLADKVVKRCEEMGAASLTDGERSIESHFDLLYTQALNNLAVIYRRLEMLEESRNMFKRALKAKERVFGPNHLDTLETTGNYSNTLRDLRELGEARITAERCLVGLRKCTPDAFTPHRILQAIDRLANIVSDQGDLETAKELYEEALREYEKSLTHLSGYVDTLNNIAILYKDLGEFGKSMKYYEKALQVGERIQGRDHDMTHQTRANMERMKFAMEDSKKEPFLVSGDRSLESVLKYVKKEKDLAMQSYQNSHQYLSHKDNLSRQLWHHFLTDAVFKYQRCLRYCGEISTVLNVEQQRQANDMKLPLLTNLALCYNKLENWKMSIDCCNLALEIDERSIKSLVRRATAYEAQGEWELALDDLQKAKAIDTTNDSTIAVAEDRVRKQVWKGNRLFTDLQMEDMHHKFCAARGVDPNLAQVMLEGLHKQIREGDVHALNNGGQLMANILGLDPNGKWEDPSEMSMKELIDAIKKAGLQQQAAGFCEKSEYVELLSKHKSKQKPKAPMSEEEILQNSLEATIKSALSFESEGIFKTAKIKMQRVLLSLEQMAGFDNYKTIESAGIYARISGKMGDLEGAIFTTTQICRQQMLVFGKADPLFVEHRSKLQKYLQDAGYADSVDIYLERFPDDTVRSYLSFARKYSVEQLLKWADILLSKAPKGDQSALRNYETAMSVIRNTNVVNYIMLGRQMQNALGISYEDEDP